MMLLVRIIALSAVLFEIIETGSHSEITKKITLPSNDDPEMHYMILYSFNCSNYIRIQVTWYEDNILHFSNSMCRLDWIFTMNNLCFCRPFAQLRLGRIKEVFNVLHLYGLSYDIKRGVLIQIEDEQEIPRNNTDIPRTPLWMWFLYHLEQCDPLNDFHLKGMQSIIREFKRLDIGIPYLADLLSKAMDEANVLHQIIPDGWLKTFKLFKNLFRPVTNLTNETRPQVLIGVLHRCLISLNNIHPFPVVKTTLKGPNFDLRKFKETLYSTSSTTHGPPEDLPELL